VGKVTKSRVIKISLAILVVVGIILGLLVAAILSRGPDTLFDFLAAATNLEHIEQTPKTSRARRTTVDCYTFEADFNDLCTRADAELTASGFTKLDLANPFLRQYEHFDNASGQSAQVCIFAGKLMRWHRSVTPQGSEELTRSYYRKSGWVTVEITLNRLRLWPPQYLLRHLHRTLRLALNKPPPRKK